MENPVIDIVEPPTAEEQRESIEQQEWLNSFNEENYYLYQRQNNDDDYDFKSSWNINTDDGETLQDYLWSQLITENFTDQETEIIKFMLECLDNKGYLEESIETIASYFGTDTEIVEDLLSDLQALDPSGVCARTLEECLKLQLERRDMLTLYWNPSSTTAWKWLPRIRFRPLPGSFASLPLKLRLLSDY